MIGFILGLLIGGMIGGCVGIVITCLMVAAKKGDEQNESV